ncbi:MAG: hypothetical protein AVDCRST_MAG42-2065, partial [uncultured Chthoniobacterales bacterium]
ETIRFRGSSHPGVPRFNSRSGGARECAAGPADHRSRERAPGAASCHRRESGEDRSETRRACRSAAHCAHLHESQRPGRREQL